MKKLNVLFLAVLFSLGLAQTASAQVDATINPIGLLFGDFSVGADFAIVENFSVEAAVGFGSGDLSDADWFNIPVNVVGKYYFSPKHGTDRFYGDVFLRYVNRSWSYDDNSTFADYTSNRFGLGFGIGYKAVSKGGFVFDIGFGVGRAIINNNKFTGDGVEESVDWPEIMFQGKLGVGYRFGGK